MMQVLKEFLLPENLGGINVDSTPKSLDFDISTNVAMILANQIQSHRLIYQKI